jgi:PAS domain S-box-containing protein
LIQIILDLAENLALLVALSILSGFIRQKWQTGPRATLLQGLLFGASAVFGMLRPLTVTPGLIFDGRSVVLSLCALFFGPWAAALAAGMAVVFRIYLGGMGSIVGVSVILASTLLGLGARRFWRSREEGPGWKHLIGLGLAVHFVMLLLMFILPGGAGAAVVKQIGLPMILTYPLVTLLIGTMLAGDAARQRAMEALDQMQKTMAEFVRHSPIHVYIKEVSPDTSRVLLASDNFVDMIGIEAKDMIGKEMHELFPAPFAEKITQDDWAVVTGGQILKLDEELNGRSYTTIKFPLRVGAKWLLAGYTIEITERKQAERALAEKELRLRTLVASIPDMVWLKDAQGIYLFCNPMFERFFGAPEAEIQGKTDYDFVDRELADLFRANDLRAMEAGHPLRNEEVVTFADDGHRAYLETTKTPMYDTEGQLIGVLGIARDMTERRQMEEERHQLESQLLHVQKMESMGSLAGGVAHDMNNVLGAIMGLASANLGSHPPESPAYKAFDTIIKASERGGKMVRSLLSFARHSLAEEKQLDLNGLIREEVSLLEHTTLARIRLVMDLAPDLLPIQGDANALTHAFMNLCVNAVDALPAGGTLVLRTRNLDRDWIEVQVEDSGCGMSKEILEKAMDPFFTTKAQGKGTGLGLSLVYSTVKAHRGLMEIHSEPDRGTRVELRFPVCTTAAIDLDPVEMAAEGTQANTLAILLVDDDELILESFEALIETLGHTPILASRGEEAIQLLEAGLRPDLVILDMNMPGLGGPGTLPRLRTLLPEVPVLLATGRADQSALKLVEDYPGVTLLAKPFGMSELNQHIEAISQKKHSVG